MGSVFFDFKYSCAKSVNNKQVKIKKIPKLNKRTTSFQYNLLKLSNCSFENRKVTLLDTTIKTADTGAEKTAKSAITALKSAKSLGSSILPIKI
jgi:hypothetical protein